MLKKERNLTIFNQVISGDTLKTVASKHQISPGRARNIVCDTYSKICKELDIEPVSWSIYEMRKDGRLGED
jgi:DNA-binding Xre family transcriptional regulator